MNYILYGNGGSGNHGCEAIIRGTYELFGDNMSINSLSSQEDTLYGISEFADIKDAISQAPKNLSWFIAYAKLKLMNQYIDLDVLNYISAIKKAAEKTNIAFSVGGDNYCYKGTELYTRLNKAYQKHGFKTVFWGCSVEPEVIMEPSITNDLKRYDLIVARETITYNAMKQVTDKVMLAADPAFFMKPTDCELPAIFRGDKKVIGINASPMIISYEKNQGATFDNYVNLINYIIDNTDYNVALIPHVVWQSNDDRVVLNKLYEKVSDKSRVEVIKDHNAPQLKFLISKCDCFIGARTHATIAAYSSFVPTLVVGYSVKARGIAKDLFGTDENYVIPVQSLSKPNDLTNAFMWLESNKESIKAHLTDIMDDYKASMKDAVEALKKLAE